MKVYAVYETCYYQYIKTNVAYGYGTIGVFSDLENAIQLCLKKFNEQLDRAAKVNDQMELVCFDDNMPEHKIECGLWIWNYYKNGNNDKYKVFTIKEFELE